MLFLRSARSWLRKHAGDFDVLHGISAFTLTAQPAAWAQEMGLPAAVKIATHSHDLRFASGLAGLINSTGRRRRLVAGLAGAIALNRAIEAELLDCGMPRERIALIPNPVDLVRFSPAPSTLRNQIRSELGLGDGPVVACCGVIGDRKRQHLLVEAMSDPRMAGWSLILIGPFADDAARERLMHAIDRGGVRKRVMLTGLVPDPERLLAAADVYCLPSAQEGMPNSVIEAMACGLPCVLTEFVGAADLLENGGGRLSAATPSALAQALSETLAAGGGAAARRAAETRHDPELVLDLHLALFRRMSGGSR
jgi:glycosyltransferase involved in cell wall biosynthesis